MTRVTKVAVCGAFSVGIALAPTAAMAATGASHCDAYSGNCVKPLNHNRHHPTLPARTTQTTGATLPFTGVDVLALGTVGLLAIGGGSVLVAAGRRRTVAAA